MKIEIIEIPLMFDIKGSAQSNFINAMDFDSADSNFIHDFGTMTKQFGQAYMEYCRAAWAVNDNIMTEEEFCKINGNIPMGFFNKKIKQG